MISARHLYAPAAFNPFCFKDDFNELGNKFSIDGIVRCELVMFIKHVDKDELILLADTNKEITVASNRLNISNSDPVLVQHGIFMAKLNNQAINSTSYRDNAFNEFCFSLIKKQHQWLTNAFVSINEYLTKRVSGVSTLTSQDVMRIGLAEVLEGIHIASTLLNKNNGNDLNQVMGIANLIIQAAKKLADCAGGRSFTGSNILEFYWFNILLQQFLWGLYDTE